MYCPNCANQINDGVAFCNRCGAQVRANNIYPAGNVISPLAYAERTRTENISEIYRMITYFGKKQAEYDEYDTCRENIAYLSNPRNRIRVKGVGSTAGFFVSGILLIQLPELFILFVTTYFEKTSSITGVFIYLAFCIAAVILGIGLIVAGVIVLGRNNRKLSEYRRSMIASNERRFDELADELSYYYQEYGYCATGPFYTNPRILMKIKDNIELGRADTIKESINILHMDAHNSAMELQAQLTTRAAASAAQSARTAAFFSAASFFLK